jgi:hypothetical protein
VGTERHTFVQAVLWVPNSDKARLTAEIFVRKYGHNQLRAPGINGNRLSSDYAGHRGRQHATVNLLKSLLVQSRDFSETGSTFFRLDF